MRSLPKVTFILEDFTPGSPGQQLLDRFLIGYNRAGEFYAPGCQVENTAALEDLTRLRALAKDFPLKAGADVAQADAVIIVGPAEPHIRKLPPGACCFVYGTIANTASAARDIVAIADARMIALRCGTAVAGAFPLPVIEAPARVRKRLAVTYGRFPDAETEALEVLWNFTGAGDIDPKVQALTGTAVWNAAYSSEWNKLFAAAFSRSNTIQGDPVADGRTQDVVGLRLVEKLVKEPRAWLIDQADGTRQAVFVMNGALEDLNVALQGASGKIVSTQLYRPPPPMQDHFSELAGQIEDFFRQDAPPPLDRGLVALPTALELMRAARERQA